MIVRTSRKKAVRVVAAGFAAALAGAYVLYAGHDAVVGVCLVLSALFALLYGFGSLADRRPRLVLTERDITELDTIREPIEWEAVRHVDDVYYRGQFWVRLLLDRAYKPQRIRSAGFRRFDRIYASEGLRAVYIRAMGLEIGAVPLADLIRRLATADAPQRVELLRCAEARVRVPARREDDC